MHAAGKICKGCGAALVLREGMLPQRSRKRFCADCIAQRRTARMLPYAAKYRRQKRRAKLAAGAIRLTCTCGRPLPVDQDGVPHGKRKKCDRCVYQTEQHYKSKWYGRRARAQREARRAELENQLEATLRRGLERHGAQLPRLLAKSMVTALANSVRVGLERYSKLLEDDLDG